MSADLDQARAIFIEALGRIPAEQWEAFLAARCGGDAALHGHVRQLLQVHAEAGSFLDRPALEVLRKYDGPQSLFYLDPPYMHDTRTAPDVYGPFEMTEADHRELLDAIRRVRGKVILSGYPSEMYDRALAGWNRHTFDLPNNAAGGASKGRETEVVWRNF